MQPANVFKPAFIAIVRHGDYMGDGGYKDSLSEEGRAKMITARKSLGEHFRPMYPERPPTQLTFAFSKTTRAFESAEILASRGDIHVTELLLTERREIKDPGAILEKVLRFLACAEAPVGIIVAHGVMPAVLAETLNRAHRAGPIEVVGELQEPGKGHGYLVQLADGEVFTISPETGVEPYRKK